MKSYIHNIEFRLPNNQLIIIELRRAIKDMLYDDVQIVFYHNGYCISAKDCFLFLVKQLNELLLRALHSELLLDSSIGSIGYAWNKLLHEDKGACLLFKKDEDQYFLVLQRYLLWETSGNIHPNLATWLYNDSKKNIILEIAPVYPWHFTDPEADPEYIAFSRFMNNYKPLYMVRIPYHTAEQWLKKISKILQLT